MRAIALTIALLLPALCFARLGTASIDGPRVVYVGLTDGKEYRFEPEHLGITGGCAPACDTVPAGQWGRIEFSDFEPGKYRIALFSGGDYDETWWITVGRDRTASAILSPIPAGQGSVILHVYDSLGNDLRFSALTGPPAQGAAAGQVWRAGDEWIRVRLEMAEGKFAYWRFHTSGERDESSSRAGRAAVFGVYPTGNVGLFDRWVFLGEDDASVETWAAAGDVGAESRAALTIRAPVGGSSGSMGFQGIVPAGGFVYDVVLARSGYGTSGEYALDTFGEGVQATLVERGRFGSAAVHGAEGAIVSAWATGAGAGTLTSSLMVDTAEPVTVLAGVGVAGFGAATAQLHHAGVTLQATVDTEGKSYTYTEDSGNCQGDWRLDVHIDTPTANPTMALAYAVGFPDWMRPADGILCTLGATAS